MPASSSASNSDAVARFAARITEPDFIRRCASEVGCDVQMATQLLTVYGAEVAVGVSLLEKLNLAGKRILEIGSGIGLLTAFLAEHGVLVEGVEPEGSGFAFNHRMIEAIHGQLGVSDIVIHRIGAEELDPTRHGMFDVIFSANVLEHVAMLDEAMATMGRVLAPNGVMIHTCANYAIPYEPHYGILLLPFAPARTPWARHLKHDPVWQSLNFVTAKRLTRLAQCNKLAIEFERGMMAAAFERLLKDTTFSRRHAALLPIAQAMNATGLLSLLKLWPPSLATPLRFRLRHQT